MSSSRFEEVLQRAERLIQSSGEPAPLRAHAPFEPVASAPQAGCFAGEPWPPEHPPISPSIFHPPQQQPQYQQQQQQPQQQPQQQHHHHHHLHLGAGLAAVTAQVGARAGGRYGGGPDPGGPECSPGSDVLGVEEVTHSGAWCGAESPVPPSMPALREPRAEAALAPSLPAPQGPRRGAGAFAAGAAAPAMSLAAGLADARSPAEVAVLMDSLERENALLRQQMDRCCARERALRAEADDLRAQLEAQERLGQQRRDLESASLAAAVQRQGEMREAVAAELETLRGATDSQDQQIASMRAQCLAAQVEAEALLEDLDSLRQFVLPGAPADADPPGGDPAAAAAAPPLPATLALARRSAARLRLACEAKLETLGQLHQQLRLRLQEVARSAHPPPAPAAARPPEGSPSAAAAASPAYGGVTAMERAASQQLGAAGAAGPQQQQQAAAAAAAAAAEVEARLRSELRQARAEAEEARAQALATAKRFEAEGEAQAQLARDLEAATRALRVREAEVRELQLLGKYFAGRAKPPQRELDAAALAEELRARCTQLSDELERARSERDLLRAERARAERWAPGAALGSEPGRWVPGLPGGSGGGVAAAAALGRPGAELGRRATLAC